MLRWPAERLAVEGSSWRGSPPRSRNSVVLGLPVSLLPVTDYVDRAAKIRCFARPKIRT